MSSQKQSPTIADSINGITRSVKKLGVLYIEKARLKTTERLTILLSSIAFATIIVAIAMILLIFVSIGIGHLLATSIAPHLAYLIVAGFYLLLFVAMILLRKPLFINPISRFMSRLLLDEPEETVRSRKEKIEARMGVHNGEGGES